MFILVDRFGVDQAILVDDQAIGGRLPKEAIGVALVASRTGLMDHHQNAIGIAIDAHLENALAVPAFFSFAPEFFSRPAVVGRVSRREGFEVSFLVHPSHHQDLEGLCILGDRREQSIGALEKVRSVCHVVDGLSTWIIGKVVVGFRVQGSPYARFADCEADGSDPKSPSCRWA